MIAPIAVLARREVIAPPAAARAVTAPSALIVPRVLIVPPVLRARSALCPSSRLATGRLT